MCQDWRLSAWGSGGGQIRKEAARVIGQASRFGFLWWVLSWSREKIRAAGSYLPSSGLWGLMLQKLRFGSPGLVCCGSLSVLFLYVVWPWSVCTFSLSRSPDPRCPGLARCAAPPFLCGWWCWGTLRPPCQADSRHPPAGLAAPRGPAGCGARQAPSLRCLAGRAACKSAASKPAAASRGRWTCSWAEPAGSQLPGRPGGCAEPGGAIA